MGTDLFKHYTFDKTAFLMLGNNSVWNIHRGVHKDRKIPVCLYAVDKHKLKKITKDKKDFIVLLKKEAAALSKIKHPNLLSIVEPVNEDKNCLGFISERFSYSLSTWIEQTSPTKLEIKSFIIDLCKTLIFLHEDAHIIHNNLNINSILLDEMNRVKISSMAYSVNDPPISGLEIKPDTRIMNFNYVAPEIIFDNKAYYASDVYSIGAILYSLLRKINGDSDYQLISNQNTTSEDYKTYFPTICAKIANSNFDIEDKELLNKCLIKDYTQRPSMKELIDHKWFNDPKLKALHFIEHLEQNDAAKNNEFLQKLPKILNMFDNKIITKRFLPALLQAIKTESLLSHCLPCIFAMSEKTELKLNFEKDIWPSLKGVLSMKSIPASCLYFLLTKVKFICENISSKEFSSLFLNIICKAMDCNVAKIQTVVSENLMIIAKKIDSLSFKNQIYPRMINIMINTNSHSLKVQMLTSLKALYNLLDQTTINDNLLSSLEKIKKNDNTSEVCMKIGLIYEEIAKIVSVESIANKILPNLIVILVHGNISKKNFDQLMQMIQKYLERIKKEREKDLTDDSDLSGISATTTNNSNITGGDMFSNPTTGALGNDKDDFLSNFFGASTYLGSASQPIVSSTSLTPTIKDTNTFDYGKNSNINIGNEEINKKNTFDFSTSNVKASKSSNNINMDLNMNQNDMFNNIPKTSQPIQQQPMNYKKGYDDHNFTSGITQKANTPIPMNQQMNLDSLLNELPGISSRQTQSKVENHNDFNEMNLGFLKPNDNKPTTQPQFNFNLPIQSTPPNNNMNMNTFNMMSNTSQGNQMNFDLFNNNNTNTNINPNQNQAFPSFPSQFPSYSNNPSNPPKTTTNPTNNPFDFL